MLKRDDCGCIYLETGDGRGRLLDYCGHGDGNPQIGASVLIAQVILADALRGVPVSDEDAERLLTRLAELVRKGHKYEGLRKSFQNFLAE
jgi:hypothetical protein